MQKKVFSFTNSAGDVFNLSPLNPLEQDILRAQTRAEWIASGNKLPEPPVRVITIEATGETETVPLRGPADADTPELKAAWAAYEAANGEYEKRYGVKMLDSCFLCVQADPAQYPAWKRRMKFLKIPIPTDEVEAFRLFCNTHVIRCQDDLAGLMLACLRTVTAISEEAQEAVEAMFQRALETETVDPTNPAGTGGG